MELSKLERVNLINQFLTLEKLYPEEATYYARHRKALEEGYVLHYKWIFEHLHPDMSERDCKEVLDILDMYRAITFAYFEAYETKKIEDHKYRFPGFDGNEECEQLAYTSYFIVDLDRYNELNYNKEFPSFNSHYPMMPKYRAMLDVWKKIGKPQNMRLNIEQANQLLAVEE
ncbi:MAG: YfbU family protein [Sphingobacteriales bacterium]|nr:MAG: YfbU family protein [Sphingobacteriales bacterium]